MPFKRSRRGRKPGSGWYPDAPSLLGKLLPIYRCLEKKRPGTPTKKECVEFNGTDDLGDPLYLGISYSHFRRLLVRHHIEWPPE